jgi:hypothetical protein
LHYPLAAAHLTHALLLLQVAGGVLVAMACLEDGLVPALCADAQLAERLVQVSRRGWAAAAALPLPAPLSMQAWPI